MGYDEETRAVPRRGLARAMERSVFWTCYSSERDTEAAIAAAGAKRSAHRVYNCDAFVNYAAINSQLPTKYICSYSGPVIHISRDLYLACHPGGLPSPHWVYSISSGPRPDASHGPVIQSTIQDVYGTD